MSMRIGGGDSRWFFTGLLLISLFLTACDSGLKVDMAELPSSAGGNSPNSCRANNSCRCEINGLVLRPGESVLAYRSSIVATGQQCASETRICDLDGNLSGTFTFSRCATSAPSDCVLGNRTVFDGETINAFEKNVVPFGSNCTSQRRTCSNGLLNGDPMFQHDTCQQAQATSCSFNGQTVAHGNSVTAFLTSSVPAGQQCAQQTRTCNNGLLSGNYTFATCQPLTAPPQNCSFNGQTVAHGNSVTAFLTSSVPAGQQCAQQTRICNNGLLSGNYTFATCQPLTATTGMTVENYPRSGKLYSTMSLMPKTTADFSGYYFGAQANSRDNFFWWSFHVDTARQQGIATIHWSTPDDYREFYRYEGTWLSLDGWSVNYRDPNGGPLTFPDGTTTPPGATILILYKIETTFAEITFQPNSPTPSTINFTNQFLGRGKPYVLENIPSVQYKLHVDARIVQYTVYQGVERRTTVPPRLFNWTVTYDPPANRNSAFLGDNKMSILQTERWVDDSPMDITQGQTICEGIGYLCRSDRNDGSVVGVTIPLSGPMPPPSN